MSLENNNITMSRLAQVQMKFQQKQMQERERKRLELTSKVKPENSTTEPTSLGAATSRNVGNGRVRQMFDERRRGAGIDRSNPLKPITTAQTVANHIRRRSSAITPSTFGMESKSSRSQGDINNITKSINSMSIQDAPQKPVNDDQLNNNTKKTKTEMALKPVVVKKAPTPVTNRSSSIRSSPMSSPRKPISVIPEAATAASTGNKSDPPSAKNSVTKIALAVKPPPRVITPPPGMATCPICSRNFNEDRLEKHKEVCQKMVTKKRKIFDATKQRVKGTGAEKYIKKQVRQPPGGAVASTKLTAKKSDWRLKHEEFIAAIRNAKKVQAHLAKGGKLSDLPPAPVATNPDYITCPHCSRRFNQAAAERHIPKCATMRHNKPKPGQPPKKR